MIPATPGGDEPPGFVHLELYVSPVRTAARNCRSKRTGQNDKRGSATVAGSLAKAACNAES
jgi:hypothetical protein